MLVVIDCVTSLAEAQQISLDSVPVSVVPSRARVARLFVNGSSMF